MYQDTRILCTTMWNMRKFRLNIFSQKFREINAFSIKINARVYMYAIFTKFFTIGITVWYSKSKGPNNRAGWNFWQN